MKKILVLLVIVFCSFTFANAEGTEFAVQMGPNIMSFIPAQASFHLGFIMGKIILWRSVCTECLYFLIHLTRLLVFIYKQGIKPQTDHEIQITISR